MALTEWAVPRLAKLLPLDEESLRQIVDYTDTLPRNAAAEHLQDILGDSPQALEFITSFQARRTTPAPESITLKPISNASSRDVSDNEVPRPERKPRKTKQPFNRLPPPRQVENSGHVEGSYVKRDEDDYIVGKSAHRNVQKNPPLASTLALQQRTDTLKQDLSTSQPNSRSGSPQSHSQSKSRLPPSATGPLISDALATSRSSSPSKRPNATNASTKINVTGGTSMRGAASTLSDLDSAIRQLEVSTNPTLANPADTAARRCNCMAQRHALLTAAPNCLSCGKIICAKEGLGPCTFCNTPLLKSSEVQAMLQTLKAERGRERQEANNAAHRRAEVSQAPRPFTPNTDDFPATSTTNSNSTPADATLARAKEHRDKLLAFQTQNAKRTRVHDEAADFETPDAGVSQWASPSERALQLKRQQKVLREQEWSAKPDYEKRRMVVSMEIDKSGKARAVRRFENVSYNEQDVADGVDGADGDDDEVIRENSIQRGEERAVGAFSRNPLLGGLIRPVYSPSATAGTSKGKKPGTMSIGPRSQKSIWRRVQDDNDDNEAMILDGGTYGDRTDHRVLAAEESACG